MAHINLYTDYYKKEDLKRLQELTKRDKHFKIEYDDKWLLKITEKS